ncbi:MAG: hypothetical protein K2F90_01805 [Clostridiales bacterium]|nr:hypothetical protein [Clostridiales bacterium]
MIKINDYTCYISAGEACYVFKIADGVPTHVYFGKRVEPEDDIAALGLGGSTKELCVQAEVGGKTKAVDLKCTAVRVIDGDGKSLAVELCDTATKLKATAYYTPHPRGGISRRVVIDCADCEDIKLTRVRQSLDCGIGMGETENRNSGLEFFGDCGGNDGDAYAFLCPNADGSIAVDSGTVACDCGGDNLYPFGDRPKCAELLCVYSDMGKGGATRVLHDVLRNDGADDLSERAATLFLPAVKQAEIASAVQAAGELGFGVVAIDISRHDQAAVQALCAACKQNGLAAGLRVGGNAPFAMVAATVEKNDIAYVMIDSPKDGTVDDWRGVFAMRNMLKKEFSDLRIDFGIGTEAVAKAFSACYPLAFVRNVITPDPPESFKSRFDRASLGTLGYELNPAKLSDGIKRAVRAQILSYQDDARCVLHGDVYCDGGSITVVGKDKSRAYAVCACGGRVRLLGLDEHNLYHVRELNKTLSGAALVHCGVAVSEGTSVLHILQVADY